MRYLAVVLCAVGFVSVIATAQPAWASGWSPPVDRPMIAVSFGASYPGAVHRGVDLPADQGAEVWAPAAGRITFAGTVPADGGGTCNAVTIETEDGFKISLLPLERTCVQAGAVVTPGDLVGRLAAMGDDSSSAPHLHLGLRQGDRYLDPAPMLPLQWEEDVTTPAPGDAPEIAREPVLPMPVAAGVAAVAPTPSPVDATPVASASSCSGVQLDALLEPAAVSEAAAALPDATQLIRDAGITQSALREQDVHGVDAAAKGTRWISGRRADVLFPVAPSSACYALAALVAVGGAAIAVIARSKDLVRVH